MDQINVLGGNGFIGKRFCELTSNIIKNDREDYNVKSKNVLYFISTVDNYNIYTNPYIDIETNLITLIKTLESCKGKDVVFNFVSSWFVYGNVPNPAKEEYHCEPNGFYSITKRTAEQLLISYCQTFNIKYRILRLGNVLGETDLKVSSKKNIFQYLIQKLKVGEDIELHFNGKIFRDYIYVDDVVQAINLILNNGNLNEIYNVANGEKIYLSDCMFYAKEKLQSNSNIILIDVDTKLTVDNILDISKIKQLGYEKQYSIYDIIDILIKG